MAKGGVWKLCNNNNYYNSMHKLTMAVVDRGAANAWNFWNYIDEADGQTKKINELRDASRVTVRS